MDDDEVRHRLLRLEHKIDVISVNLIYGVCFGFMIWLLSCLNSAKFSQPWDTMAFIAIFFGTFYIAGRMKDEYFKE